MAASTNARPLLTSAPASIILDQREQDMKKWAISSIIALGLSLLVYWFWASKGKGWEPDASEMAVLIGLFLLSTTVFGKVAKWLVKRKAKPSGDSDASLLY